MKTGLVLEGGACRGVFTAGVLDTFQRNNLTFDYCVGVSAGAGNAMNYKSRQPGRAYVITSGEDLPEYYGLSKISETGNFVDLDLLYETLSFEGEHPFDFAAYYDNPMVCEYAVTSCETGQAEYLSENVYQKRLLEIVKASSAMPGICHPREIDGQYYLDGGIADPMPVFHALNKGCDKVVLVTTKPAADLHPTDYTKLRPVLSKLYKKRYPAFYVSLMTRVQRYFAQLDEILELEKEGQIFMIRPEHCEIRSLEKDRAKMRQYYHHGEQVAESCWDDLMKYLNEDKNNPAQESGTASQHKGSHWRKF